MEPILCASRPWVNTPGGCDWIGGPQRVRPAMARITSAVVITIPHHGCVGTGCCVTQLHLNRAGFVRATAPQAK